MAQPVEVVEDRRFAAGRHDRIQPQAGAGVEVFGEMRVDAPQCQHVQILRLDDGDETTQPFLEILEDRRSVHIGVD